MVLGTCCMPATVPGIGNTVLPKTDNPCPCGSHSPGSRQVTSQQVKYKSVRWYRAQRRQKSREGVREDGPEIAICHSFVIDIKLITAYTTECLQCARNCSVFPCISSFNAYIPIASVCDDKPCCSEEKFKAQRSYVTHSTW